MKPTLTLAVAAILAFGSLAAARAADKGDAPAKPEAAAGSSKGGDWHEKMKAKMKEKLGLTDEQSSKLEAAHKAHQEAVKPLHEELKKELETLRSQVKDKASDDSIKETLDKLTTTRLAIQAAGQKMHDQSEAILTPTQRAKMALFMGHRMHERGGMKGGKDHKKDKDDDEDGGKGEDTDE